MKKLNPTLLEFKAAIVKLADDFVERYKLKYPESTRSTSTILEFIKDIDVPFRENVANIAVGLLQHQCLDDETKQLFFEKNSWSLSKLFVGLLHASTPKKKICRQAHHFSELPMPECEEFEQLKEAFIAHTTKHIEEIKKLSFEQISCTEAGRRLLCARSYAMNSHFNIYKFINKKRYAKSEIQPHTSDIATH